MTTQTERHLQVIAEKIETINNLQQVPVGTIPTDDIQVITEELQAIGEVVFLLPESFTDKYSDVLWNEMKNWASLDTLVSGVTSEQLTDMICDLKRAESEIHRHVERDSGIQEQIIASLNASFENRSKEWYAHIQTTYLLISITVIIFLLRIEVSDLDIPYSNGQISTYIIHTLYALIVVLEIQFTPKFTQLDISGVRNFSTITEFYDTKIKELGREISDADTLLRKRKTRRLFLNFYWLFSLISAIIITVIDAVRT